MINPSTNHIESIDQTLERIRLTYAKCADAIIANYIAHAVAHGWQSADQHVTQILASIEQDAIHALRQISYHQADYKARSAT